MLVQTTLVDIYACIGIHRIWTFNDTIAAMLKMLQKHAEKISNNNAT